MINWRKPAAFFAACIVMIGATVSLALGDVQLNNGAPMIFVPSANQAKTQRYSLAVRGLARGEINQAPQTIEYLPGAVFGIYAPDAQGNMQPWPDPYAPQSPLLIRTEATPVHFDLPDGTIFFVRQESAPEGYQPMPEGYWSIEGQTELRVDNAMPGGLIVRAESPDGAPIAGVHVRLMQGEAQVLEGETGADGVWKADALPVGAYSIEESDVPQDFLPAQESRRDLEVSGATWASATFVHQRMGRILVQAERVTMHPDGKAERVPLADVGLAVLDGNRSAAIDSRTGKPILWTTDANGLAQGALPAGDYTLKVTRQPKNAPTQLAEETAFAIVDGQDVELPLTAQTQEGYVRFALTAGVQGQAGIPLAGIRCVIEQKGSEVGTFVTDGAGQVVTTPLLPGDYIVRYVGVPTGYALPNGTQSGQALTVQPAQLLQIELLCPSVLSARWSVCIGELDDRGEIAELPVGEAYYMVLHEDGSAVIADDGTAMQVRSDADGSISLTLPSGNYLLQPQSGQQVLALAVDQPIAFTLPQEKDTIDLLSKKTRLSVHSVQQDGARLGGSSYRAIDKRGNAVDLVADAQGVAISPALEPGSYTVQTLQATDGFGPADAVQVDCLAGVLQTVDMAHKPLGRLEAKLLSQALNSQGGVESMPLSGVRVTLLRLNDGGDPKDPTAYSAYPSQDAPLTLTSDAQGIARDAGGALPMLPSGTYRAAAEASSGDGATELSDEVVMSDGQQSTLEWASRSSEGGIKLVLHDAENAEKVLTDAAFTLQPVEATAPESEPFAPDAQGVALRVQLPQGQYRLRQTRCPDGYAPMPETLVEVEGGTLTELALVNARHGVLAVDKQGFTFDAELQKFRVPLRGAYAVFTMQDGAYQAYPSQDQQLFLTSHGMQLEGGVESAQLPAAVDGATYYLREVDSAVSPGYVLDTDYHEAKVYPGQTTTAEIAAVANKGFFVLRHLSADDAQTLTGGAFALYAKVGEGDFGPLWESEPTLTFALDDDQYQNPMALPVGDYRLVMQQAPQGYMLDDHFEPIEQIVQIPAYVHQGNPMAQVEMRSARAPQQGDPMRSDLPLYGATQEVRLPQGDAQADILSVTIGAAHDQSGAPISAQLVYCLAQGGWNWGDARTIAGLEQGAQAVDLGDVASRIVAVQIRYQVGRDASPQLGEGFAADPATVDVAGQRGIEVASMWSYEAQYRDERGQRQQAHIQSQMNTAAPERTVERATRPDGQATASGGVSGNVWRMRSQQGNQEDNSVAEVRVLLEQVDAQGTTEQVDQTTPDAQGNYTFGDVRFATYRLRFVAPEGDLMMQAKDSDGAAGEAPELSPTFTLSSEASWYWAQAGLVRAAGIQGSLWLDANMDATREADESGASGVRVSVMRGETQVTSTTTDENGGFAFVGLLPGSYALHTELSADMLYTDASQGADRPFELELGERLEMSELPVVLSARLAGSVMGENGTRGVPSANVELLRNGADKPLRTMMTDANGAFSFDQLTPGSYSLRIALPSAYVFPREPATQEGLLAVRDVSNGQTDAIELAMGGAQENLLVEALRPAKVTVAAWEDSAYLGKRAEGAAGVAGVKVALAPAGMPEDQAANLVWQTTGPDGVAKFEQLEPGTYELWYELSNGWRRTRQVDAQGVEHPMRTGALGRDQTIQLGDGQEKGIDLGLILPATLRGAAWLDANDNGLWDAGESPMAQVQVRLEDPSGAMEALQVDTDEQGAYAFDELPPGTYRLAFEQPEGYLYATDASASKEIQLALGQTLENQSIGLVQTAALSGMVWEDTDNDGGKSDAETGVPGASLSLYRLEETRSQRTLVSEQPLDPSGSFAFADLRPGKYQLDCNLPSGYVVVRATASEVRFAPAKKAEPIHSDVFTLSMGQQRDQMSLAALRLGSIAGLLWEDADYNGLFDQGERTLSRAAVSVWQADQTEPIAAVTTGKEGTYRFDALPPGAYELRFTLPEGFVFTKESDQSLLSSEEHEATLPITLTMGEERTGLNAGALVPASMSGLVWVDENNDGMLDANEPPIASVTVQLVDADDTEQAAVTTESDEQGRWSMENLMPGSYKVKATLPDGYLFATAPKRESATRGGDIHGENSSEGLSEAMVLKTGQQIEQFHIGGIPSSSMTGAVWLDADDNGVMDASDPRQRGVTVTLMEGKSEVASVETDDQGTFSFDSLRPSVYELRFELPEGYLFARIPQDAPTKAGLVAAVDAPKGQSEPITLVMGSQLDNRNVGVLQGASIRGKVWVDPDESGTWDETRQGMPNALVECMSGSQVLSSARTAEDGTYRFDNLRPGTYAMRVTMPEGDLFSAQASEVFERSDAQQGTTASFTLAQGDEKEIADVPALHGASIGGVAWEDADVDGAFSEGEAALPGVSVALLRQEGDEWKPLGTKQVDDQGAYHFDTLRPGVYKAQFTLPSDFLFTSRPKDAKGTASAVTRAFEQSGETEPIQLAMADKRTDLSVGGIRPGMLGDTAWVDENGNGWQDDGEPALTGATVVLLSIQDGNQSEVATQQTDQYGFYRFDALRPGLYRLKVTLPNGYGFTVNHPEEPEIDSDIVEGAGPTGESADFVVQSGQSRRNIDIGARKSGQ